MASRKKFRSRVVIPDLTYDMTGPELDRLTFEILIRVGKDAYHLVKESLEQKMILAEDLRGYRMTLEPTRAVINQLLRLGGERLKNWVYNFEMDEKNEPVMLFTNQEFGDTLEGCTRPVWIAEEHFKDIMEDLHEEISTLLTYMVNSWEQEEHICKKIPSYKDTGLVFARLLQYATGIHYPEEIELKEPLFVSFATTVRSSSLYPKIGAYAEAPESLRMDLHHLLGAVEGDPQRVLKPSDSSANLLNLLVTGSQYMDAFTLIDFWEAIQMDKNVLLKRYSKLPIKDIYNMVILKASNVREDGRYIGPANILRGLNQMRNTEGWKITDECYLASPEMGDTLPWFFPKRLEDEKLSEWHKRCETEVKWRVPREEMIMPFVTGENIREWKVNKAKQQDPVPEDLIRKKIMAGSASKVRKT